MLPPTCDVTPAARFFPDKLEGSKLCALLGLAAPVEKQEESTGVVESIVEEIKVNLSSRRSDEPVMHLNEPRHLFYCLKALSLGQRLFFKFTFELCY